MTPRGSKATGNCERLSTGATPGIFTPKASRRLINPTSKQRLTSQINCLSKKNSLDEFKKAGEAEPPEESELLDEASSARLSC